MNLILRYPKLTVHTENLLCDISSLDNRRLNVNLNKKLNQIIVVDTRRYVEISVF